MKCQSCNAIIPLHFDYVIGMNVCPSCGRQFVTEEYHQKMMKLRPVFKVNPIVEEIDFNNELVDRVVGILIDNSVLFPELGNDQKGEVDRSSQVSNETVVVSKRPPIRASLVGAELSQSQSSEESYYKDRKLVRSQRAEQIQEVVQSPEFLEKKNNFTPTKILRRS